MYRFFLVHSFIVKPVTQLRTLKKYTFRVTFVVVFVSFSIFIMGFLSRFFTAFVIYMSIRYPNKAHTRVDVCHWTRKDMVFDIYNLIIKINNFINWGFVYKKRILQVLYINYYVIPAQKCYDRVWFQCVSSVSRPKQFGNLNTEGVL